MNKVDIKEGLTTKLGPFPAWVYGVVGGAAIAAYMFWQRRKNAGSTASVTTAFDNEAQNIGWGSAPYSQGVSPGPEAGYYDSSGGGVDMFALTDAMGAMLGEMSLQADERFQQWKETLEDNREIQRQQLEEQRAANADAQASLIAALGSGGSGSVTPDSGAAVAAPPAPNPDPPAWVAPPGTIGQVWQGFGTPDENQLRAMFPGLFFEYRNEPDGKTTVIGHPGSGASVNKPAATAVKKSGTVIWHGGSEPNMTTLRKANPGLALRVIDNKGHKPGSSRRYVVVVA